MLSVTLYDPRKPGLEPPHVTVPDAVRASLWQDRDEYREEREKEHQKDPSAVKHRLYPCAACDWKAPEVKKARAKKRKALDRFMRTGKLPPLKLSKLGVSRIPKPLSDEEVARVVLPDAWCEHPPKVTYRLEDRVLERACSRYLEAKGEARRDGGDTYTCECVVTSVYGIQRCDPCDRHRGAFEGTGDNE